jgi:hypothetical protein
MSDPIPATYVSSSSFSVIGDQTEEYLAGRKIKLFQTVDNETIVKVVSSSYDAVTTVVVTPSSVNATLTGIKRGPTVPDNIGSVNYTDIILPSGGDEGDPLVKSGSTLDWGEPGGGGSGVTSSQSWIMALMGIGT